MERKRIAIIGSGISGLSTFWTLRNTPHTIHLFEKEDRLGGHTNTVPWTHNGHTTPVDTGFIVLNTATYPNFIEFLKALNVKTIASEMTFGVSRDAGLFEWSGTSGAALFAQRFNILSLSFWRMIFDIIRFNQFALDLLSSPPSSSTSSSSSSSTSSSSSSTSSSHAEMSIGSYLDQEGYSAAFRDDYLIPMTACVWSTGPDKCALEFPALTLVRFMWNHHLLSTVAERPPWLTVQGGAKTYVDAVMRECGNATVHLDTSVESTVRRDGKVELTLGGRRSGEVEVFDEVVLACHGDQARSIVGVNATSDEKKILDAFETTPNVAYLHSDLSLMPKRRAAWSAWNYLTTSQPSSKPPNSTSGDLQNVSLTYNMNILQSLPVETYGDVLVTLNPAKPPAQSLTQATYQYRHPLYNARMVAAQEDLELIQGKRGIWYAGAWTGYGFHEDGFASGMKVGLRLGGQVPWKTKDAKFSRGMQPVLGWKDYVVRAVVVLVQFYITVLEGIAGIRRKPYTDASNGHAIPNGKAKAA
ncbi:amine oxidase-like protein [Lophiostoma macrostomum CBS 122681]|uniref:Amine oxidase-like protein n=1 Tax=Lophiostoma macrostomum CBS 122681 TaxID=1314788 RepID=A0A6A6TJG2_9PLEO|nr:amine oxidase-like protein [Lophiostoma macrostomum CBS 122681]